MPGTEAIVEEQEGVVITGRRLAEEGITEEAITEEGREPLAMEAKAVAEAMAEAEVASMSVAMRKSKAPIAEAAVEGSAWVTDNVAEVAVAAEAAREVQAPTPGVAAVEARMSGAAVEGVAEVVPGSTVPTAVVTPTSDSVARSSQDQKAAEQCGRERAFDVHAIPPDRVPR